MPGGAWGGAGRPPPPAPARPRLRTAHPAAERPSEAARVPPPAAAYPAGPLPSTAAVRPRRPPLPPLTGGAGWRSPALNGGGTGGGGLSQLRAPLRLMSSRARGAISGGRWREAALPPQRPATCDQITGGAGGGGSWVCRARVSPRGRDGALKAGWGVPRWCPPPLACGGGGGGRKTTSVVVCAANGNHAVNETTSPSR